MIIYRCEDSIEGIFTAIYRAYEEKRNHNDTRIAIEEESWLFAEHIESETDRERAAKVANTLLRRFGEEDFQRICLALSAADAEKAQGVYQTVVYGLSGGRKNAGFAPGHLFDNLAEDCVNKTFSLARAVGNEAHHLEGFVRFQELKIVQELERGVLFSKISPKNNVMTFLMPHFAERFPMENFMIMDEPRELFGIHPAGKEWYLAEGMALPDGLHYSDREKECQELFTYFCHKIAIRERENKRLQSNMLPSRFRENMVEFRRN